MAIIFPSPAGQTPLNTFSPTSTPSATTNGLTYVYDTTLGVWTSAAGGGGGGGVTGVTATAPIVSSGGTTPAISATLATAAQAAAGTSATTLMTPQFAVPKDTSGMGGAALLPSGGNYGGTTSGMFRFNTTSNHVEFYDGSAWQTSVNRSGDTMTGDLNSTGITFYNSSTATNNLEFTSSLGGTVLGRMTYGVGATDDRIIFGTTKNGTNSTFAFQIGALETDGNPDLAFGGRSAHASRSTVPSGNQVLSYISALNNDFLYDISYYDGGLDWKQSTLNLHGEGGTLNANGFAAGAVVNLNNYQGGVGQGGALNIANPTFLQPVMGSYFVQDDGGFGSRMGLQVKLYGGSTATAQAEVIIANGNRDVQFPKFAGGGTKTAGWDNNGFFAIIPSDARLKENVNPLENALEKINQLNAVKFNWADKEVSGVNTFTLPDGEVVEQTETFNPSEKYGSEIQYGFIAQEVEEVDENLVSIANCDFLTVDLLEITPLLVKALQEATQRIEILESELAAIKES